MDPALLLDLATEPFTQLRAVEVLAAYNKRTGDTIEFANFGNPNNVGKKKRCVLRPELHVLQTPLLVRRRALRGDFFVFAQRAAVGIVSALRHGHQRVLRRGFRKPKHQMPRVGERRRRARPAGGTPILAGPL